MVDKPPFDPATLAPLLTSAAHNGWLGLKYQTHGKDWVELSLPWREDLGGEDGGDVLASGPIISLLDMASGLAVWNTHQEFRPVATLNLHIDYIRPARAHASVFGRSHCYRLTRSAAFVRGYAHDGNPDDPLAHFQGVFMNIHVGKKSAGKGQ
jgi:uncharacterized protein (TIGR00369 family)